MKTLLAAFNQEKALLCDWENWCIVCSSNSEAGPQPGPAGARVMTSGILFLPKQPPATWCLSLAGEVKRINLDTGKYVGRRKLKRLTYCHVPSPSVECFSSWNNKQLKIFLSVINISSSGVLMQTMETRKCEVVTCHHIWHISFENYTVGLFQI